MMNTFFIKRIETNWKSHALFPEEQRSIALQGWYVNIYGKIGNRQYLYGL